MKRLALIPLVFTLALAAGPTFAQRTKAISKAPKLAITWLPFQVIGDDNNRYSELEVERVMGLILKQPSQSDLTIINGARTLDTWENQMGMPKPLMTNDEKAAQLVFGEDKLRELCSKVGATHLITGTIQFHRQRDQVSRSTTNLYVRCTALVVTPKERTYLFNWDLEMPDASDRKDRKNWFMIPKDDPHREWKVLRYMADYTERPKDVKLMYQKATGVALAAALSKWYTATFPDK